MKLHTVLVALSFTLVCTKAVCAVPQLKDLPKSTDELGDIFVEAWISFRTDLDTTAHGGVHPDLLDQWMNEAPLFLAADAARLSNEPAVLLAAGERLATLGGDEALAILKGVEEKNSKDPIAFAYTALRVRAGDKEAAQLARELLGSKTSRTRLQGAKILCLAKRQEGVSYLRSLLAQGGNEAQDAARVLGRYGPHTVKKDLETALSKNPERPVIRAALGELFLRQTFPQHQEMMKRRDPTGQRFSVNDGLYDEWLKAAAFAADTGVRTSSQMLAFLEGARKEAPRGDRGEVFRRRLKSFMEFWSQVDAMMTRTEPTPPWPQSFKSALARLRSKSPASSKAKRFAARVSAAIALCTTAGARLGHSEIVQNSIHTIPIAPGARRTLDRNLATSWVGKKGMSISLDLENGREAQELWLANFCPRSESRKVIRIQVSSGGSNPWSKQFRLKASSAYFEKVTLPAPAAARLTVKVIETTDNNPACISEILLK